MLNKDEYNQEEYNEYYRQETGRGEPENEDEGSGILSKLILLAILLALTIAGYFGYKTMNKPIAEDNDSSLKVTLEPSLPQSIQKESDEVGKDIIKKELPAEREKKTTEASNKKEIKKEETKKTVTKEVENQEKEGAPELHEKTSDPEQSTVTSEVNKAVSTRGKMSPEEIAAVVNAVMKQLNQKKSSAKPTIPETTKEDSTLINELSDAKVDSVADGSAKEIESVNINEKTKIDNSEKQIDVYNKVNVENTAGEDTLSQLSEQISAVIAEGVKKDKAVNYTQSLKSEVTVRTNEMRIIVVKKGDTLGKIAKRAYGNVMEFEKIYQANPELTRPDRIYIGQKLRIPN